MVLAFVVERWRGSSCSMLIIGVCPSGKYRITKQELFFFGSLINDALRMSLPVRFQMLMGKARRVSLE